MAQIFYTTFEGSPSGQAVNVDLEQILAPSVIFKTDITESSILVEDGDTFQCGKCLHQFSFMDFILHKKNVCTGIPLTLAELEANGMLSQTLPPLEGAETAVIEDNNNQELVVGLEREVFSFKMEEDSNQNSILVESLQEFEGLGGPPIRIIENDDTMEITNPIIGNNYLLSHNNKETSNEILLNEECTMSKLEINAVTIEGENISSEEINSPAPLEDLANEEENEAQRETEIAQQILFRSELTQLKCFYCQKEFRKNFDLQQHIRSHTGERPFQCVVCGRAFAQKSHVMKHVTTHKVWPKKINTLPHGPVRIAGNDGRVLVEKMFVCQYCPSVFSSYTDLKSHRTLHTSQKVFKCVQKSCHLTFKDLDEFLEHTQTHTNMASYECHICHMEFSSLDDLGQHQIFHDGYKSAPKQLNCSRCKAKFMSSESLEKHMLTDSHNYSCPTCGKVFASERFLRRHISIHSPTPKYSCSVCQKRFRTEHYLNIHATIHSEEKPFACEICSAKFNRRDKLARHNLTHENAKKFKCHSPHCNKEFNRKDKLKQHVRTHSGSWKKFVCRFCSKSFSTVAHCENHAFLCGPPHKAKSHDNNPPQSSLKERVFTIPFDSTVELPNDTLLKAEIINQLFIPVDLTGQASESRSNS